MCRRVAFFIAGTFLILALRVAADNAHDWPACNLALDSEAIAACSNLISSGITGSILATVYNHRGLARERSGDFDGAIADYTEAIRLNPNYATTYFTRGSARERKGDFDGAIADYSETIRLNPHYKVFYSRAIAYREKGDYDHAMNDFAESIRLNPNYVPAYTARGSLWEAKGDINRARADYDAALTRVSTDDPDGLKAQQIARDHLSVLPKK